MKPTIINCHIHTFTHKHVPYWYPPFPLNFLSRSPVTRSIMVKVLRTSWPFSPRDYLDRLANFAMASAFDSQKELFQQVRGRYPLNTRFVVLPMDMRGMKKGKTREGIIAQHDELYRLYREFPDQIIPYIHVDPRSAEAFGGPDPVETIAKYHELGFKGIKLYPPLGYDVESNILEPIYQYADDHELPVMVHCSKGGVSGKGIKEEMLDDMLAPHKYRSVLSTFKKLRLCLAHFGGQTEWEAFLNKPWVDEDEPLEKMDWLRQIYKMMQSGKYPNLYTDISYTIFRFEQYVPILKVLLSSEEILNKTLFGSDFYMIELEKLSERELSMKLRGELGEDLYWKIASENPQRYLGE